GVRPMIDRTVVVLPMPFLPISVTISPGAIASDTPWRMRLDPYPASIPSTSSSSAINRRLLLGDAEVGFAHLYVRPDRLRYVASDDAAIDENRDAIGERKDRIHVVLDQENCEIALELPQHADHDGRLLRSQSRHWFI